MPSLFRFTRFLLIALAFASLTLASGCRRGAPVMPPQVQPTDVTLEGAPTTGLTGTLTIDVYNPNPFAVPLERIEYKIIAAGSKIGSGTAQVGQMMPAQQNTSVTVDMRVSAVGTLFGAIRMAAGRKDYRIEGNAFFTARRGKLGVRFVQEGELE